MDKKEDTATLDMTAVEKALLMNDLAALSPQERLNYYMTVCQSLGLNPLTQPFEYLSFQGKLKLYANRNCAEQLRKIHGVSVKIVETKMVDDTLLMMRAVARIGEREEDSTAAIDLAGKKGDDKANALMKCETKAKRRVTLSICGLGILDETEVETIPGAVRVPTEPPRQSYAALITPAPTDTLAEQKEATDAVLRGQVEQRMIVRNSKIKKLLTNFEKLGLPKEHIDRWVAGGDPEVDGVEPIDAYDMSDEQLKALQDIGKKIIAGQQISLHFPWLAEEAA